MKNKLYKLISLLLSIFILATAVMIPAMAETQAKTEIAYYVKNGGTGDGKTMATPAATVKDVIETIKADGYDADDTVTVYILQRDDWNVYNGEKIGKINGTNTTQPHNMTAWSVDGSAPNTHDFTMIVKSPEGQKNYLTYSQNLGQNSRMAVGGNTVFDNVILVAMRNELDQPLGLKGYNVRFTENFAFGFVNNSETLSTLSVWDRTVKVTTPSFLTELAVSGSNLTDNDGMTLTLDTKYDSSTGTKATKRKLVIGTNESRARTVKFGGDVNVIINNKDSYVPIQWGSTSQNSTLTFENNLNINVKAAKQIVNAAGASPITIKGGLQIIADSKATITDLENTLNTKGISNYWYLVNGAAEDDITFTATAGTFKAKEGITLVAVKEGTTTPIYSNAKGELVLEPGKYAVNTSAGTPPVEPKDKMLHITSQNAGPLGQLLSAKPNDVYIVEVTASNNLGFSVAAHDGSSRHKPLNAKVEFINGKDEGKYASWTYEVTMPDVLEDKGNNVFLGVAFNGTAPYDGYLMKVSVYKKDDANKTELFKNIDFAGAVLDNWRFKYTNFTGDKTGLSKYTFQEDNKDITLEIVDFDVTILPTATANFPLGDGRKMLHITSQNAGPLGQLLSAKPNDVYIVEVTTSNNLGFSVATHDGSSRHKPLNAKVEFINGKDEGKYASWTYEVTMPDVLEDKGNNVFLGVAFNGTAPYDGYLMKVSVYKKDDANKTELFNNIDFAGGVLDNWRFKYTNFTGEKAGLSKHTFQEDNKNITLEVVKFDESVMETVSAVFPDLSSKMLHITTADTGPIGQQVKVKGNEKFVMSFDMSNNIMFDVVINDKERRHAAVSGVTVKYLDGVDHGRYTTYTYEITMPEKVLSVKTGEETDTVVFGIKFKAADNYDGYLANAELYKKGDTTNTNLYKNGDFFNGYIDGWVYKYHSFLSGDKLGLNKTTFQEDSKDVTLEVVKFDESVMENVAAKLPDFSRKMVYFKNGALSQPFSAWVDCVPGRKFIVTYSLFSTSDEIIPHFNRNGLRQNVNGKPELLSEVKHGNYTTYTYRMTIPQDYEVEEKLIFLGFKMPFYAEGYLFDVECYVEGDSEKKSAWKNPQFAYGFNEWVWGWSVTMFTRLGDQVKEWSDGVQEIKLVPFDLTLIDKLILEINRDDGEWWKPTDIIEKEDDERGVATINGTFKLQDGTAIANATMILKSLNKTYTAITNENGAFSFKNVVADYYDLYYVDDKGEEVLLDFACVLENGDTATVSIVNDLTELTKVKVSGLKGTVYTPQLKVVSNLKVYLRGFGETSTNKDGSFVFSEVPVGKYELYTVLDDGSEYVFREVEVKENVDLAVKLKYDPQVETQSDDEETTETFALIWIVIACGVVVILAAGIIIAIVLKKKKK